MICTATFGNGARIGMGLILKIMFPIPKGLYQEKREYAGVDHMPLILATIVQPFEASSTQKLEASLATAAFVSPGIYNTVWSRLRIADES